jgi:hypothetical protein
VIKHRCPACGAKNGSDAESCERCGYVLYENCFGDIAGELEEDMSSVSAAELAAVRKESGGTEKLTPEEFEQVWCAANKKAPIHSAFSFRGAFRGAVYERELRKAYEEYLRSIGYDK